MPERPGGAPFINGLPASVIERYEREHPEEQRTATKEPEEPDGLSIGETRRWTRGDQRDPHQVMRLNAALDEVLIKYRDRTTDWWPRDDYLAETEPDQR
jgi:hypothetical protein